MYVIRIVSLIAVFLLTSCGISSYPVDHEQLSQDERIVIRFSHVVGENTPKGLASRKFAEEINKRTDGFIEVQVFPNSNLYKDGEEIEALLNGSVQMIAPATSKMIPIVPELQVLDLPFAFRNAEEVQQYVSSPAGRVLERKLEEAGIYLLTYWSNGFKQMTNSKRVLKHPGDFSDLNFRVMATGVLSRQFELLGGSAQVETFDRVYTELEAKNINAQENTFSNIYNKNIYELQKYLTISNHGFLGYFVLVNGEFWNELTDENKMIILETMEEISEWETEIAQKTNEESYQKLEECNCIEIYELTEEERATFEQAFEPIYEEFAQKYGNHYIDYLPKNIK